MECNPFPQAEARPPFSKCRQYEAIAPSYPSLTSNSRIYDSHIMFVVSTTVIWTVLMKMAGEKPIPKKEVSVRKSLFPNRYGRSTFVLKGDIPSFIFPLPTTGLVTTGHWRLFIRVPCNRLFQ